jgi:hypothetical protein
LSSKFLTGNLRITERKRTMSNPNPSAAAGRMPRLFLWIGWMALAGYAVFLARNFSNVAAGADSSGYLNSARLLASGQLAAELRTPPEFGPQEQLRRQQFQPHGFVPFDGNPRLSPTYAVGFPLHLAVAGRLFGWQFAPAVVGVAAALAAVMLCFAIATRLGIHPWLAAAGSAILAAYPVFIFTSIQPLSDTLATTWCLAAVHAALRARQHAGWALACGAALAIAVLVRVTNVLLLPVLVILLGADVRRMGLLILGGLPGALWLGYYNHSLYGSAFRSGYVDISQAFGWAYGWPTLVHFVMWLALLLPVVLLVLPLAAPGNRHAGARSLFALAWWFAAFTLLYIFYEISHEVWWDLRFILPATPALILAGLLGVETLASRRNSSAGRRLRGFAAITLAMWAIALGWFWTQKFHLLLTKTYEQAYADAAANARAQFPANALVIAGLNSGALYYYTNFPVLRWEFVNPAEFAKFRELTEKSGRPICALLFQLEEREALQEHCPGNWTSLATRQNISLWRLDSGPANSGAK